MFKIPMELGSPLPLFNNSSSIPTLNSSHEDWLDIDNLSPSLPEVCLQDVESVVLLGTYPVPQGQQEQHSNGVEQADLQVTNSFFDFATDAFGCYDSPGESLSECSSLSGWSDTEPRENNIQFSDCSSPFTYFISTFDEGPDADSNPDLRPLEAYNIIGYSTSESINNTDSALEKSRRRSNLKRPKNGFIRFAMKYRKFVADEHPNLDNREISRILGVRWRKLSMTEKYAYEVEFHKEMADRKRHHPDWKYGGSRMNHELLPMEPIPSRLRPRETLKRRAIPRLTRPYRRRKPSQSDQNWVQCDRCNKWRKLPPNVNTSLLPEKWFCEMKEENDCSAPESLEPALEQFHDESLTIKQEDNA